MNPVRLHLGKGVCMIRCSLPLSFCSECPGSFRYHCGNTGVERTPSKSQHRKSTLLSKFSSGCILESNQRSSDHKSAAQLTELAKPPYIKKGLIMPPSLCVVLDSHSLMLCMTQRRTVSRKEGAKLIFPS